MGRRLAAAATRQKSSCSDMAWSPYDGQCLWRRWAAGGGGGGRSLLWRCSIAGQLGKGGVHLVGDALVLLLLVDEVVCGWERRGRGREGRVTVGRPAGPSARSRSPMAAEQNGRPERDRGAGDRRGSQTETETDRDKQRERVRERGGVGGRGDGQRAGAAQHTAG